MPAYGATSIFSGRTAKPYTPAGEAPVSACLALLGTHGLGRGILVPSFFPHGQQPNSGRAEPPSGLVCQGGGAGPGYRRGDFSALRRVGFRSIRFNCKPFDLAGNNISVGVAASYRTDPPGKGKETAARVLPELLKAFGRSLCSGEATGRTHGMKRKRGLPPWSAGSRNWSRIPESGTACCAKPRRHCPRPPRSGRGPDVKGVPHETSHTNTRYRHPRNAG